MGKPRHLTLVFMLILALTQPADSAVVTDVLNELKQVQGSDFEAVGVSSLMVDPDSGQVFQGTSQAYLPIIMRD